MGRYFFEYRSTLISIQVVLNLLLIQDSLFYILKHQIYHIYKKINIKTHKISAATGEGLKELFKDVAKELKELPKEEIVETDEKIIYTLKEEKQGFEVKKVNGEFIVSGPDVDKLMARVNLSDNESMYYFQKMLANLGIEEALRKAGAQDGDTIRFNDWEFDWYN